eukprot:121125-Chlamydomonas_euryale.AAC.1
MEGWERPGAQSRSDGRVGTPRAASSSLAASWMPSPLPSPSSTTLSNNPCGCRAQVREAVTLLALDPIVRPCPVDGATWRPQAIQKGGKRMFPFLVDPNTGEVWGAAARWVGRVRPWLRTAPAYPSPPLQH